MADSPSARTRDGGDAVTFLLAGRAAAPTSPRPWWSIGRLAAVIGAVSAVVAWLGSGTPSYWGDEAASVLSAQRSLSSLLGLLANVDAVHGVYYAFLHEWIRVFGSSELATRTPSALAEGVVVAGTVVLTARFATTRIAVLAGIVCAVLPRVTFFAVEARSYAIGTAVAVWLTVALVVLVQRRIRSRAAWAAYGLLLAAAV